MKNQRRLIIVVAFFFFLMAIAVVPASADLTADLCGKLSTTSVIDTVEGRLTPVPYCYIHGTLDKDRRFEILLPKDWNGKFVMDIGGGWGGTEFIYNSNIFISLGYALGSSNQGHIDTIFKPGDTFQELNTIANHQLTLYAKSIIKELYGTKPRYTYATGTSAGAWRSLSLLEAYPNEYDGATVSCPALEPRFLTVWMLSLPDYYFPVFWSKLDAIVRARDLGEDPVVFAGLTAEEAAALNQIYDGGAPRGSEFAWPTTNGLTIRLGYIAFTLFDPTYLTDFWTVPGYEGHDGVAGQIIQGITGKVTAIGTPDSFGEILSFTDASKNFSANQVKGYTIIFTSGKLAGASFHIHVASHTSNALTITGYEGALNGIAVGDTYTMHNRDFLAWKHYYRHIVLCDRPEYKNFCSHGHPIYVQRPHYVQKAYNRAMLTGEIHAPVVMHASAYDEFIWNVTVNNWIQRVHSIFGSHTDHILRVYWGENTLHEASDAPPPPSQIDHVVEKASMYHKGFELMTQWVEHGIAPPPSTVVSITPGNVVFPSTAWHRKGIQPVVNPRVEGVKRVTVHVGQTVHFNGVAESPIANIAMYEWDFEGNNSYDCAVTSSSSNCGVGPLIPARHVNLLATHVYNTPGTYVPTVRVTDDTVNPDGMVSGIENLARVVVDVIP